MISDSGNGIELGGHNIEKFESAPKALKRRLYI